ncbi:MAG: hypothetical protein OK456_01775 [Thaumarchaeota archaeon]|nr:hypothetical protein [Nitrososphaerota archaeon]
MKILIGSWFYLPRMGSEVFSAMMKEGVVYDKKLGFKLDPATDLELAVRTISAGLGDEVELTVRCFLCGTEACPGCPYIETCDRSRVSSLCLCEKHSPEKDVYELYQKTYADSAGR